MNIPKIPNFLKQSPRKAIVLLLPVLFFLFGWWIGLPSSEKGGGDEQSGQSDTVWTCSMHPQIRQPNFGLCPICNMDLIPLQDDGGGGLREITVSKEAASLLDLRVSPVIRTGAVSKVKLFGRIDYDERKITTITSRVGGRLDRLFVDFTGAQVRKGDHLAEIYSPDLLVAQRELIEASRSFRQAESQSDVVVDTRRRMLQAARQKLRLLQFNEKQIADIEKADKPNVHLKLHAPQAGIVTAKFINEGQYVKTGDPLFKVADLSAVWLKLEAYEDDLQWLRYAQDVEFRVDAMPGRVFHGRIAFIDPEIDHMRRIARIRVNVLNDDFSLKPGMFANATVQSSMTADGRVLDPSLKGKWISPMHPEIIKDGPGSCDICGMDLVPAEQLGLIPDSDLAKEVLLIPVSAALRTGPRAVVYVKIGDEDGPKFEGREVVLGARVGDQFIVHTGLSEGELVVSRGAFKLDSELQIKAKPSMMNPNAGIKEQSAGSAQADLAGQWRALPRLLHWLIVDPSPKRIDAMTSLLEGINSEWLQPDEMKLWGEFSSRLDNQLFLARSEIEQHPKIAVRRVVVAVEEAGRYLGLPHQPVKPPAVDPKQAEMLKRAIGLYLPVAKALADDNDDAAKKQAEIMSSGIHGEFKSLADAVAKAVDIKSRRAALQPLSNALIAKVREVGIDAVGNAYVVHCPMAFDDTGADWISAKPDILNPYFGDEMLSCGFIVDALSFDPLSAKKEPRKKQDHKHHNH